MQSPLPLILSYPLVNIFESGRRLQQQHLVTYLWTCHPSCKQSSPSSYFAILPIPDHNTLHDFIRIELDGWFWSNFEDVDSIPSEKPHETTFLINVPKTCYHTCTTCLHLEQNFESVQRCSGCTAQSSGHCTCHKIAQSVMAPYPLRNHCTFSNIHQIRLLPVLIDVGQGDFMWIHPQEVPPLAECDYAIFVLIHMLHKCC